MINQIESKFLNELNVSLQHKLNQPLMVLNTSLELLAKEVKNEKLLLRFKTELKKISDTLISLDKISKENINLKRIEYIKNTKMVDIDGLMEEIKQRSKHFDDILGVKRTDLKIK